MARYSKKAQKTVASAMRRMKKGELRSGGSGKKVKDPKQAIAIGLSEAREKGAKVPKKKAAPKKAGKKSAAKKKVASKKVAAKKAKSGKIASGKKSAVKTARKKSPARKAATKKKAAKKVATKKKTTSKKAVSKKKTPVKTATKKKTGSGNTGKDKRKASATPRKQLVKPVITEEMIPETMPVDSNVEIAVPAPENEQHVSKAEFSKFTKKGDPFRTEKISSKPKGAIKPAGKKPLW